MAERGSKTDSTCFGRGSVIKVSRNANLHCKSKEKDLEYIKEKVWKKIQGWREKMLSKAGKEILIKVAIPVYTMACFDITKSLCEELSSMIGRY